MFIQSKMVAVLIIIFLGCSAVAQESENCDRLQVSFDDQEGINNIQNFTKQSLYKNEKPVYYSVFRSKKLWRYTIMWWNNQSNNWLSQTGTWDSNKIIKAKILISHQNFKYSGIS